MMLLFINLLMLSIISFPKQTFGISRFNIYGINQLKFAYLKVVARLLKPFITHDLTNNILILVFINSTCLAFYLVDLPDSSYTGLYKNIVYSFLSASVFSIFISSLPNERRKYTQAQRIKIEFTPLIERDNMIRTELNFWDSLTSKNKFNIENNQTLQNIIITAQANDNKLSRDYCVAGLHHHGLSIYHKNTSLYQVMIDLIQDDITFILRIKECDTSLFPEIDENIQDFESQIVWLKNTVSGVVKTEPDHKNKAIAQSISACMTRKQNLLKAYSDSVRNYCNDPLDCISDKLTHKSIKMVFLIKFTSTFNKTRTKINEIKSFVEKASRRYLKPPFGVCPLDRPYKEQNTPPSIQSRVLHRMKKLLLLFAGSLICGALGVWGVGSALLINSSTRQQFPSGFSWISSVAAGQAFLVL